MSSHHFVRDEQEPALLVDVLNTKTEHLLGQLLEWAPKVICVNNSAERLISLGHKVDLAVFTKSSFAEFDQDTIEKIELKEEELYASLFQRIEAGNQKTVTVLTTEDHLPQLLGPIKECALEVVLYTEKWKYVFYRKHEFTKWLTEKTTVSIKPQTSIGYFSTTGFFKNLSEENLAQEKILKKHESGFMTIYAEHPPYLIGELIH